MDNFPKRPISHINGDKAVILFRELCPKEWIVREIFQDYGLDLLIEPVKNGIVNGHEFYVQIKSIKVPKGEIISIPIRQATINYWLAKLRPIVVVGVDIEKKQFVFEWIENAYVDYPNYSEIDRNIQLQIPLENTNEVFETDTNEYVTEFYLKLGTELANAFENTQLSRILFHASELHRLVARAALYLSIGDFNNTKEFGTHIYQFLLEFSIFDGFFEDAFTFYKTKKSERFSILNHHLTLYKEVRAKFYKKENIEQQDDSDIAFIPVSYTAIPDAIHQLMGILDKILGILLQALLLGKFTFPT
jgi:hypothetical protein